MIHCSNCERELNRTVFCDAKCKMQFSRAGKKPVTKGNKIEPPVTIGNKEDEDPYKPVPFSNLSRPALSFRDKKGQCQHKRVNCSICA